MGDMNTIRAWAGLGSLVGPRSRRWLGVFAVLLAGALAGAVGFAVQPEVTGEVGPGTVTVDPASIGGDTVVHLPPLGQLRADSHAGPLSLTARLERIDFGRAGDVARLADPAAELRKQIETDLSPLISRLVVQSVVVALVSGALVALVLPRRRWRYAGAAMAGSVGFVAIAGGVAVGSFEPTSFDEPTFEGTLAAAPDVINTIQKHIDDVGAVESRLESLSDRMVALYESVGDPDEDAPADVVILHVSDLHSNPVGIELVEETAERFGVDAILDTGDVTSFGSGVEAVIAQRLARIDTPYHLVPGNHDSMQMRAVFAAAGVDVLDPGLITVGDVRILGVGEPTFTADNRIPRALWDRNIERSAGEIGRMVRRERPDVVAVHNRRQLADAHGRFAVGVAGHVHEPTVRYEEGTVIIEAGSAGATGVGALMEAEDLPYQMQLLHFEGRRLTAVDRIEFRGTAGAFNLQRILIDPDRVKAYPNRAVSSLDTGPLAPLVRPFRPQ